MKPKVEKLPKSRIKFSVVVPGDVLARHYADAVKKVAQYVEIKGFRKGHAPEALVVKKAGNGTVLQEMIDLVLPDTYYQTIKELDTDIIPVSQPQVDVKEFKGLEDGNLIPTEMTYTAEVDVMPEFSVDGYQKIKVKPKKADDKIDAKEVDGTVEELKKLYGDDYLEKGHFKDDAEMRQAIEDNIRQQKIFQAQADTYDAIIDELLKKIKVEVPETFTHNEIHRMESQVEAQAKMYGMTLDDWMKMEGKTHESIHTEWHDQAEKAAKVGLILGKIAEAEGIDPTQNVASRLVLDKLYEYATGQKPGAEEEKKNDKK